jgi:hypothetical protein
LKCRIPLGTLGRPWHARQRVGRRWKETQGIADEIPRRQRRVRNKGTHPRRYAERYKELDPERHAGELDKVRARGDTPAGTHRRICGQEI